jgi:hypothetical protein
MRCGLGFQEAASRRPGLPAATARDCAQWIARRLWNRGDDCLHQSTLPPDIKPALGELIGHHSVICDNHGLLRFAHNGLLEVHLADAICQAIEIGLTAELENAQTPHSTDLIIGSHIRQARHSQENLRRWMGHGASEVLRVNAAGILAKLRKPSVDDLVVRTLRADQSVRTRYIAAVASRVLALPWNDAMQLGTRQSLAPWDAWMTLLAELRNEADAGARWCTTALLYHAEAWKSDQTRTAIAQALQAERSIEVVRAMAALAVGADPINLERPAA